MLDALSFRLRLPDSISISVHTFGVPRVGNPEFVSFFNSQVRHDEEHFEASPARV